MKTSLLSSPCRPSHPSSASHPAPHAFYDADALFRLPPEVVRGFSALLASPEADPTVAYYAVIDGNVLAMCLGASTPFPPSHLPSLARTRALLVQVQGDSRKEREVVYAYATVFRTLEEYHREREGRCCLCLPPCRHALHRWCCERRMRKETLRVVEGAFRTMKRELGA